MAGSSIPPSERTSEASRCILKPACQNEVATSNMHSYSIIQPFGEARLASLYGVVLKMHF